MVSKEFESSSNQMYEGKPVRRRMARDIYFVFEEGKKKCSNNRSSYKDKSKFGHLKIGEVHKTGVYAPKNFFSIRNKKKCFVNARYTLDHKACYSSHNSSMQFAVSHLPIAKVNPIFVWVKQDDTTIVEVRCEDYDKRNRIRLTKTLNGWRATPRTDPTSSRVVKIIPRNFRKVSLGSLSENKDKIQISLPKDKHKCNNSKELENEINIFKNDKKESNSYQSNDTKCSNKNKIHAYKDLDLKVTIGVTAENACSPEIGKINENNNLIIDKNNLNTSGTTELDLCPKTGLFVSKEQNVLEEENLNINEVIINLENSDLKTQSEKHQYGDTSVYNNLINESNVHRKSPCNVSNDSESINCFVTNNLFESNFSNDTSNGSDLIKSFIRENCYNSSMDCYDKVNENIDISEITKNFIQVGTDTSSRTSILSHKKDLIPSSYDNIGKSDPIKSLDVHLFHTEMPKCLKVNKAVENEDNKVDVLQNGVSTCSTLNNSNDSESININLFENEESECISHNELGVIDDLNLDLFQTGSILDVNKEKEGISNESFYLPNIINDHSKFHITTNEPINNFVDEFPEDLSYRKVETICASPKTQNSNNEFSSNILKSFSNSDQIIVSPSQTITNIFEEITKLSPFNDHQKKQAETVNLENCTKNNYNDKCSTCYETITGDVHLEEPTQKRVRSSFNSNDKLKITNDPDPLTQLKILIHNSQWKLPDPILVPRELLGAILESPAREIPLLLASRPELKLPEAFSYPEILKNPNMLVISIAQLEAILRAEMDLKLRNNSKKEINNNFCHTRHQEDRMKTNIEALKKYDISNYNDDTKSMNCNHINSCLETNLSAARLALLNKMLLVPYSYERLSSDVLQLVDNETIGLTNSNESYILSLHNQEIPKDTSSEVYNSNISVPINLKQKDHISVRLDNPNRKRELLPTIELPTLEAILQSKMNRLHSINKIISELDQAIIPSSNNPCLNQNTFAVLTSQKDLQFLNEPIVKNKSLSNVASCNSVNNSPIVQNKNNNVDFSNITLYKNVRNHQKSIEYKPKLTCKSLSNLIYPENMKHAKVPLLNLITSNNECFYKYGDVQHENIKNHILRHSSPASISNECTYPKVNQVAVENTDSNASLWHPYFGSSNKSGYCSPWQWTTITTPGE